MKFGHLDIGSNNPTGFMITMVAATTYEPSWDDPPSGPASRASIQGHCKVLEIAMDLAKNPSLNLGSFVRS